MSVTQFSQTETYNAADVNAVIAQLLALDGSTTMTGTLLQSPLNVLRKAGQTGQEEIWYEYAGDPAYIQIVRNAYYSGGWKAKYPWDDGVNYLHPCRIIIGDYGKLYFEHAVGPSGGVNSAITWETGDINGRQFLSDAASGTPPFVVASATQVPNLNADMVDGMHGISNSVSFIEAIPLTTPVQNAWTTVALPASLQGKRILFLSVQLACDPGKIIEAKFRPTGASWSNTLAPGCAYYNGFSSGINATYCVVLPMNEAGSIDYFVRTNTVTSSSLWVNGYGSL